jgi:amino acid adenylation domain-containing protein
MNDHAMPAIQCPREQEAIRQKCFHPTANFVQFPKEDVETSIPDRFERISRQYPDQIAVKAKAQTFTYSELNAMANRIGRTILARQGNQVEPVGLLFNDPAFLAAAMLGVLKAGKFFVLLDPLLPPARLALILETSQTGLVVAERQSTLESSGIAESHRCLVVESADSSRDSDDLRLLIPATALAYVVYTSGSTGRPKGVLQSHRNLLHRVLVRTNRRHFCAADRIAHLTANTSNAVTNFFLALLNGATLVCFNVRKEGATALARWLAVETITICRISSALFRRLCENLTGKEEFSHLRLIELTSDTVRKSDVDLYKSKFPRQTILVTALSSSETGFLTEYMIDHESEIFGDEVPVGYPVEDKEILIVNDKGSFVGVNKVGEIMVRSRFLSPGYWVEPELTAAKFKVDQKDNRFTYYMTGDLGLLRPDGCLIHKGRKDFRVKVRGYSVEIADVEHSLQAHPEIKDAVVVSRQDEQGEARLVAYLVARRPPGPILSDMRAFLRERLPDYMIPAVFESVKEIPLTSNGKIYRSALPASARTRPNINMRFVAPDTPVERQLAEIWQSVLALEGIGIHDDFFDLGGDSLAATRVVSRVIKQFQVEVPLQSLYQSPTVAEMAAAVTEHQAKKLSGADLDRVLAELESLSDHEAQRLLVSQTVAKRG